MRIGRLLIVLAGLVVWPRLASAQAVTLDSFVNGFCDTTTCTSGTTWDLSLTVAANTNRELAFLGIVACNGGTTEPNITSVTWDQGGTNQALSKQATGSFDTTGYKGEVWALPAGTQPTTGTHTLRAVLSASMAVTCVAGSRFHGGAFSVFNVNQTTTFTALNAAFATSAAAPNITLSSSGANDLGVTAACHGTALGVSTETEKWNVDDGTNACNSSGGATAAGGDTAWSFGSGGSDSWGMIGGVFKSVATACTPTMTLLGVGRCG